MLFRYKIPTATPILLALWFAFAAASFDVGFQSFLTQQYGATIAKNLIRSDLGVNGSFGGNNVTRNLRIYRQPLILVHGLNANASTLITARDFFNRLGYGIGEIYATSYGPNGSTVDASSTLQCNYVKQIRQLISAVTAYTNGKKPVVVGYSLGAAIARKAILGGICVDTNEVLGSALTNQISVFLSVAGSNLGALECNSYPTAPICGSVAGFKVGSKFLKDLNSKSGYEGLARFSIGSKTDDIVGFANLSLPGSQINVTLNNFNHGDTIQNTLNIQSALIAGGYVNQRTVDKDAYAESKLTGSNCTGTVTGGDAFEVGPHASKSQVSGSDTTSDDSFPGEYNRQGKIYTFLNGYNYTRHLDPTKGKFFSIRSNQTQTRG